MPALYKVKILELNKVEASVKIHVKVINYDIMRIYETVGFGLLLLDNNKRKGFPLGDEITYNELYDDKWCSKYGQGFVKKVEIIERITSFSLPAAILKIYCTDVAWFAHLSDGEEWESNAWNIAHSYQPCEPILHQPNTKKASPPLDKSIGWMPIPSFLFEQAKHQEPKVFFFPRFTGSSYELSKIIDFSGKDREEIMFLHGKYVIDMRDDYLGIFVWNERFQQFKIYEIDRRSSGAKTYNGIGKIKKMGLFTLKPNFSRQEKWLNYVQIFNHGKPVIKDMQRVGKAVTLTLIGIDDIGEYELNKAKILKLICNDYVETYNYVNEKDSHFPISKLLKYFIDPNKEIYDPKGAIFHVADGIILNFSIEEPEEYHLYYDWMKNEELIQHFENEDFTRHKIHIELSDEAFGIQLENVAEHGMGIELGFMSQEVTKLEKPILWKDYKDLVD